MSRIECGTYSNVTAYEGFANIRPANAFTLFLDFNKPPLLDVYSPLSAPTPNGSRLTVEGDRSSWIAAVTDAVTGVTSKRRHGFGLLHRAHVYDFGLLLFALPLGFVACGRIAPFVEAYLGSTNSFLVSAVYVYVMFLVAHAYRAFFGYTKWAFPTVELNKGPNSARRHRNFWIAVAASVVAAAIWSVFG